MSFEQGASLDDGRYELRRRIGSGGMASVWLAQDTRLERPVAIKIPSEGLALDPVFARRFEREALLAASLSHPHLVPVYDYGREGDRPYLVMEYVDGKSLSELLDDGEPVDAPALARALLGALEHIHAAGIVHRDVKPGNVLVERSGRILLTDFGIAQADEATGLTGTGQVIGTLRYIAPEVMNGERASARSDLYACGVLLAEFLGENDPPALRRLVAELSADDPAERPGSATSALAQAPPSPTGGAAVERPTAPLEPSEPLTLEQEEPELPPRDPAPTPADPEPTPVPFTPPPRTPASVSRSAPAAPPPGDSGTSPGRSTSSRPGLMPRVVLGFALLAAIAAVAVAISASGDDDPAREGQAASTQQEEGGGGKAAEETEPVEEEPVEEAPVEETSVEGLPEPAATPNPTEAAALNDEGKRLIDAGDPASAVPILERAVSLYPADSSEIAYGYALFNYANALRLSGQPEAAIPVLERRMQIDDQLDVVQAELDLALQEAGQG